jgi:polyphosphate kinase 2 (PPK2 family)
MVIFDHSWYGRVLEERVEGTITEKVWRQAYRDTPTRARETAPP